MKTSVFGFGTSGMNWTQAIDYVAALGAAGIEPYPMAELLAAANAVPAGGAAHWRLRAGKGAGAALLFHGGAADRREGAR